MKKTLLSLACAAALGAAATAAQAGYVSTDIYTPGGGTLLGDDVYTIDYNAQGVAVVTGAGPFGAYVPAVGTVFDLRVMTTVVGFTNIGGGAATTAAGAADLFVAGAPNEITAVAQMKEVVVAASANTATFAILPVGSVTLYYGANNANYSTGAGFDDGQVIYSADITGGSSGFNVFGIPPSTGLGSVNVTGQATAIDTSVFADLTAALVFNFVNPEGQSAYPQPTTFPNQFFVGGSPVYATYTVNFCAPTSPGGSCDLPLRFDGSSRFLVPEPSTLALLGLGLFGFGWASRRKSS
jgi:hypothetical protein